MKKYGFLLALWTVLTIAAGPALAQVLGVRVMTRVDAGGQKLVCMRLKTNGQMPQAGRFTLNADGRYGNGRWHSRATALHQDGDEYCLYFDEFEESWFDVGWWDVSCQTRGWSFNKDAVTETCTEVADEFISHPMYNEDWSPTGENFDYSLYTPEGAGPFPLVLVLHGMTDWDILYTGREATVYAEPESQKKHPCYVLVPYFDDGTTITRQEVLERTLQKLDAMIESGKVDPERVYLSGMSMGGYHSILLMTRMSERPRFAAALLMAPWLDWTLTEEELARAVDTPCYLLYGEQDPYIPNPGEFAERLEALGGTCQHRVVYPWSAFEAAGADSQHSVDLLALSDSRYVDWLFEQRLGKKEVELKDGSQ